MSNQTQAAQGSAAPVQTGQKFSQMNLLQKTVFIGKLCIFFVTFGFAFGNILSD
jgi:hypothetical protein